ncbi:MAG: PAS domain S-box protein [Desulfoprunum sp.]|nr:PAS domain S-box protein [Desulfoprunum sp.]
MGIDKDKTRSAATKLRRQAEELLRTKTTELPPPRSEEELQRLVHELEVHQIELEMQNAELLQARDELEVSRNTYAELYDFAPVGYFTLDARGLIREVNLTGAQLLGIERGLLANTPLSSFIADADGRDVFSNHLKSVLQRQGMQRCEIRLTREDGTVIYGQLQSVVMETLETKDGYILNILTSIVDGTARKQLGEALQKTHDHLEVIVDERTRELTEAHGQLSQELDEHRQTEEALRKSEGHLQTLVQTIPDLIWLKDKDSIYLSCNPMFERFFGAGEADIIGKTDYDFVDRELADFFVEHDRRAMAAGKPTRNEEWITFADDGHRALLEVTKTPMLDAGGALIGVLGIGHDITERNQIDKKLQENEAKYRDLFEDAPIGIFAVTTQGQALSLNTAMAHILAFDSPQEALGRINLLENHCPLPEQRDRFLHMLQEKGRVVNFEYQALTADGRTIWLMMNARTVQHAEDGSFIIEGFATDITAQRRLEDQFIQAQKMESVGRLAGGVAHDYNNMLSVIIGHAEMALVKMNPFEPLYDNLQEILKAARRSTEVTRQLLAFARKQTIAPKVIDLNETVEGMLKMLRRLIGEDINLAWLPGRELWPIKMDPSQLDQILANLCVNARDAITGVGKITIETFTATLDKDYCNAHLGFVPGDFVLLAVSDDGCGMDKEIQAKVFDPFFTTKEVGRGTGLGLATVYGIVKQNNGFVNLYSEPGKGTTFKVFLPCHVSNTADSPEENTKEIPLGHGETILVVEDEPAILNLSKAMLESLGYAVLTANTTGEAMQLAKAQAGKIDLLIIDVVMPEMNGRELADQLQSLFPDIKILFMSGYTADVIAHHGVLAEGVCFIQKPLFRQDLAAKVHEVLARV